MFDLDRELRMMRKAMKVADLAEITMLLAWVKQISGISIVLLILLDVFLTVLYARMGSGLLSPKLARTVWRVFRLVARSFPRHCDRIASFCGPVILVCLVFVWVAGLTLGNGLLFHPVLGSAIRSSSGNTPTDFVSALYAGGSSISIVGSADFSPQVAHYRLIYLFNSIVGLSVTSLTLTYLMQIYSQLQQRNTFGLKVYLATSETGDAAALIAGLAPGVNGVTAARCFGNSLLRWLQRKKRTTSTPCCSTCASSDRTTRCHSLLWCCLTRSRSCVRH